MNNFKTVVGAFFRIGNKQKINETVEAVFPLEKTPTTGTRELLGRDIDGQKFVYEFKV